MSVGEDTQAPEPGRAPGVRRAGTVDAWRSLRPARLVLWAGLCGLVLLLFAALASPDENEAALPASEQSYNLLTAGFRSGQLSLKREVPAGLASLPNPYDSQANLAYRLPPYLLHDLSYRDGRLYLYFGPTPAVVLFWPWVAATGHWLSHRDAVLIFCDLGFLASVHLLGALVRRLGAPSGGDPGPGPIVIGVLGLGLATGLPLLLLRSAVYEVAISCAFALVMASLCALERSLGDPLRRRGWLVLASLLYGLALGARPSLLPGAVVLLAPVAAGGPLRARTPGRWACLLAAAILPITAAGLALLAYNRARFGQCLEFGLKYQLTASSQSAQAGFSLRYVWFNLRLYLLGASRWNPHFPFLRSVPPPPAPVGHFPFESAIGVLSCLPLSWLVLAAPLCLPPRDRRAGPPFPWLLAAVAGMGAISLLTLCLWSATCQRFEVEFLPELMITGLAAAAAADGRLGGPARSAFRGCVAAALAWSVFGTAMTGVWRRMSLDLEHGDELAYAGDFDGAVGAYRRARLLYPDSSVLDGKIGNVLLEAGRPDRALPEFQAAVDLAPGFAQPHDYLGVALSRLSGRLPDAIREFRESVRLAPNYAEGHYNLGLAFSRTPGRLTDSISEFEEAVRLRPGDARAHNHLGAALTGLPGRLPEAEAEFRTAIQLDPGYADAHYNLANALAAQRRVGESIPEYRTAVLLAPRDLNAHNNLGAALASEGRLGEAVAEFRSILLLAPADARVHYNLASLLKDTSGGRREAVAQLREALRLKPDFEEARRTLAALTAEGARP